MVQKKKLRSPSFSVSDLRDELAETYPDLTVTRRRESVVIRGAFPVKDAQGTLDRFYIQLTVPSDFPDSFPVLREIGGRIPWTAERHMFKGGNACPQVPEEWLILPREQRTILSFLKGPAHNYFLGQLAVEAGLGWPFGERSHGLEGLLEAYCELLDEADVEVMLKYLDYLGKERVKGHWPCPCGSGKILRKCHVSKLRELQEKILPSLARKAQARLVHAWQLARKRIA